MTRPTTGFPDFAMNDVIDPSSGRPNVVEPPAGKKNGGFIYNEKPPRQYINWMQRLNSLWIRYFDSLFTINGTFVGRLHDSASFDATFSYTIIGDIVIVSWGAISIPANTRSSDMLYFIDGSGGTHIPTAIKPGSGRYHVTGNVTEGTTNGLAFCAMSATSGEQLFFSKVLGTEFDKTKATVISPGDIIYKV